MSTTVEENKAPQQPTEMDVATPLKNGESDGKRERTAEEAGSPMDEVSDESPPKKTKEDETSSATVEKTDDEAASAAEPDSTKGEDATNVEEKADATNVEEKAAATNVEEKAAEEPTQPDTSES